MSLLTIFDNSRQCIEINFGKIVRMARAITITAAATNFPSDIYTHTPHTHNSMEYLSNKNDYNNKYLTIPHTYIYLYI